MNETTTEKIQRLERQLAGHRADGDRADDRMATAKLNIKQKLLLIEAGDLPMDEEQRQAISHQLDQATLAAYDAGRAMGKRTAVLGALADLGVSR